MGATRLYRFGASAAEVQCALLMGRSRSVLASAAADSPAASALRAAGFAPLASEWHCVRDLAGDPRPRDRKSRRALSASLDAWRARGLSLELTTVSAFGLPRLEEEFYYPILVRDLYSRGRAPHGAQNLDRFRQLARPHTVLALVRQDGRLRGAGLLHCEDLSRLDLVVAGTARPALERSLTGDVYCLEEDLAHCRRAFLHALGRAAALGGWSALSYGADLAWVDRGYVPVIVEKLRWSDAVLAAAGGNQPYFRKGPATGEQGADPTGLTLVVKTPTRAEFDLHAVEDMQARSLAERLARINRQEPAPAR